MRIAGDVEFFGADVVGARVDRAVVDAVNKVVGVEIPYVRDVAVVGTGVVFVEILVVYCLVLLFLSLQSCSIKDEILFVMVITLTI